MKKVTFILFLVLLSFFGKSQSYTNQIDPYWDNYYNNNPSGIESKFESNDFIRIMELVNFIPKRPEIKGDVSMFKRAILKLNYQSLNQMMIDGSFYSRTIKHNDYFYLYNSTYQKISKSTWDKYAPYLIPLMNLDGQINLK